MKSIFGRLFRSATRLSRVRRLTRASKALTRMFAGVVAAIPLPKPAVEPRVEPPPRQPAPGDDRGRFDEGTWSDGSHSLAYKLYSPPGKVDRHHHPLPLVVMLHGCKQDPDNFARGTGMNGRAREQGFFVLYPAQSKAANPLRCWNWFKRGNQRRGGEAAMIAGLTQTVIGQHAIDPRRVYVAGLSAGGAMAAIVGSSYPEIYAAIGVHSGLALGAAGSAMEALSVMKHGKKPSRPRTPPLQSVAMRVDAVRPPMPVPTIVFQGDADTTVHPSNAEQVIAVVLDGAARAGDAPGTAADEPRVEQGASAGGQKYTRSMHVDDQGKPLVEYWLIHGAGHAWSGGDASGSFTDGEGPDATGEMLRFFFEQPARVVA